MNMRDFDPTLAKSDWCHHFGISDSFWLIHGQLCPKLLLLFLEPMSLKFGGSSCSDSRRSPHHCATKTMGAVGDHIANCRGS